MLKDLKNQTAHSSELAGLAQFEFEREIRLVDTDASGFAHIGSYIRMMEETEYEFLRSRNLSVVLRDERGKMGFPRLSCNIDIHQPLAFNEQVVVRLNLQDVDGKQVTYRFQIVNEQQEIAVEGRFVAAFCRFPAEKPPYAILLPEHVIHALTGRN